jgi:urease accessory protein
MRRATFRTAVTAALLLAPSCAFAHPGHGDSVSFLAGLSHPFGGVDHLLAMTAVGLLAAHLGGRALLGLPATFVAVMALGGIAGATGMPLPFAETAMALSVLVFGFMLYARLAPPVLAAMALVGVFAVFHGYAHGSEMPVEASGALYGLGFMVASASLHGLGIALGLALGRFDEVPRCRAVRACGAAIAVIGLGLTLALV